MEDRAIKCPVCGKEIPNVSNCPFCNAVLIGTEETVDSSNEVEALNPKDKEIIQPPQINNRAKPKPVKEEIKEEPKEPEEVPVINKLNESSDINIEQPVEEIEVLEQPIEQPNEKIFNEIAKESSKDNTKTKQEELKENIIFVLILLVIELIGILIYLNRERIFSSFNSTNQIVERGEII